jgi:hypothetical protein
MFAKLTQGDGILRAISLSTFAFFLGIVHVAGPAQAQDVTYTTVSKGEYGGSLGTFMQMMPGADEETRETVFLSGPLMRMDTEGMSTVLNAGEGRFTVWEHEPQTYYSYTLEEIMAYMSTVLADVEAYQPEVQPEDPEAEIPFEVKVSTEQTGRTMDVSGFSAEQFLIILEMVPTGEEAEEGSEESGAMAVLTELWICPDFPGWEDLKNAQAKMAEQAMGASETGGFATGLQAALASNPRMAEAFEKNMEAMKEMDGMAVKTVTSFVTVPTGADFDPEQVMAMADQPLPVGEGAAGVAAEGAREAARGALRGISRGILGRRQEEPEEESQAVQTILMRMTTAVENVQTGSISEDTFRPPATYVETDPPWKKTGQGT